MAYPIDQPNGLPTTVFPAKVIPSFFTEYIQKSPFRNLMGTSADSAVVLHDSHKGDGTRFTVSKMGTLDYRTTIKNFDTRRGKEQLLKVFTCSIDMQSLSRGVIYRNEQFMQLATPLDIFTRARPELLQACERNLTYDLLKSAMSYDITATSSTNMPSYDRVLFANLTTTRTTYMSSSTSLMTYFGQFTGAANNGLSAAVLDNAKIMASAGGARDKINPEARIRPLTTQKVDGWETRGYILLVDPLALPSLMRDPFFKDTTIARGTIVSPHQPQVITGADYVGIYNGIHIYSCPELEDFRQNSKPDGSGNQVAWNLLIGAQAWGLSYYADPWIVVEDDQIDLIKRCMAHETRGQDVLKFEGRQVAANPVENGIIHVFTQI